MKIEISNKSLTLFPESEAEKHQLNAILRDAKNHSVACSHTEQWGTLDVAFKLCTGEAKGKLMNTPPYWVG